MNDRYGVDPCAASTVLELASLLRQFGPEHGRFIANFPPDWRSQVGGRFPNAADIQRARLTELLRKAKQSLLPAKARYSADLPWAKNAERLTDVQGRIGPAGATPPCKALEDVLIDPEAFPDCRGAHIPRTPAAYVEVCRPLFQISPKVVLVDPHFHLCYRWGESGETRRADRYVKPFKALIQAAQAERVEVFRLMVSPSKALIDEDDGERFEADLSAMLKESGVASVAIEYGLLDEEHPLDKHPRYLLGNECGLRFDWGFDVKERSTQHVEWVGRSALTPLLERFM